MQLSVYKKQFGFTLFALFAMSTITPSLHALTVKKIIGTSLFVSALAVFIRLVTKKTEPKRVYPTDDSFEQAAWFVYDELLTGQMEKGERPSRVTFNPDNPNELIIEYSKIEARGVAGIIYSKMKPVIIPALTLILLFNTEFKKKCQDGIYDAQDFINDPFAIFGDIYDAIANGRPQD